ncbi:hypothetical protein BsWGS_18062 [Bradybaena similaris]
MATGDLKNNIKQLQSQLKATKFPQVIDIDGLVRGSPQTYLAIYHYLFTSYNTELNSDIANSNNELYGKSDMRFMEAVYKILRDMFDYKPHITREQFFSPGFAERKVIMATDILRLVYRRYEPPKSSSFRVAAAREETSASPREKVHQEPVERPRKIASKSPPDMAGAIVLPKRPSSAGGGYKIPKSSLPGHKYLYESSLLGASSMATRAYKNKQLPASNAGAEGDSEEVSGTATGHSVSEPVIRTHRPVQQESPDNLIRRKFVDLVSPALVKVNEKIDKLQISLMNLEKKEKPKGTSNLPSPSPLTAGLTKQMSDVVFKLDTLTSRVVLIENRLLMIESRLDDEEKYKRVLSENKSYPSSKMATVDSTQLEYSASSDRNNNSLASKDKEISERKKEDIKIDRENTVPNCVESDDDEGNVDDLKVVVIREDTRQPKMKPSKMAFIKTLVNKDDLENTLVSDVSCLETSASQNCQLAEPASSNIKHLHQPFEDMVSPIKSYIQDDSVIGAQYIADDSVSTEGRRSSTPSDFMLDVSTMDRVSRIHQMMAETKQLFL